MMAPMSIELIYMLFVTGIGVFLLALMVRLWNVLGYIREACSVFLAQSEYQKARVIEMYKNRSKGKSNHPAIVEDIVNDIAKQLKVPKSDVLQWIRSETEQ